MIKVFFENQTVTPLRIGQHETIFKQLQATRLKHIARGAFFDFGRRAQRV